uniref:BED-type domain-containing protein n=1 Tax=Setaria digitata TaxID=48799 RepID=A0A915PMR0_9BILA
MDLGPNSFTSQQHNIDSAAFIIKRDPEKTFALVEATATASALADISAIISQQFTNHSDNSEDGATRDTDHPCWDYIHKSDDPDFMVCRVCTQRIKPIDTQKAMEHFINSHPQIAAELEQSWQMKLQLKSSVSRPADESSKEGSERRGGHGTEHPCWRYFTRNRKSADCRMCGTHVAYACSGNLMRHLRSRHISESVITQKEWEEIQKRKKQLCELRMMATANACGSEEQPPSNAVSYAYVDEEQDGSVAGAGEEYDGIVETDEQRYRKENSVSSSTASDVKVNSGSSDVAVRNIQTFAGAHNPSLEGISPKHQQHSGSLGGSRSRSFSTSKNAAFQKRINSFVSGLAEELSSFPMQKSLICMRRIRKFMDEQLLELDEVAQIFDDDAGIS